MCAACAAQLEDVAGRGPLEHMMQKQDDKVEVEASMHWARCFVWTRGCCPEATCCVRCWGPGRRDLVTCGGAREAGPHAVVLRRESSGDLTQLWATREDTQVGTSPSLALCRYRCMI